jgi:formyltetrahydrofolate synthetase
MADGEFKSQLFKIFDKGITAPMEVGGILRKKYSFGNDRFQNMYRLAYSEYAAIKEKAEAEALSQNAGDAVKIALKAKIERQAKIEKQIADIEAMLETGKTFDTAIIKNAPKEFERKLTPTEIANFHKTITSLNAELSKMAGEYAPTRTRIGGDPDSPPLQNEQINSNVDLTKLSTGALLELRAQMTKGNDGIKS